MMSTTGTKTGSALEIEAQKSLTEGLIQGGVVTSSMMKSSPSWLLPASPCADRLRSTFAGGIHEEHVFGFGRAGKAIRAVARCRFRCESLPHPYLFYSGFRVC